MGEHRQIVVTHDTGGSTCHTTLTCEYDRRGDFSITWRDRAVSVTMRRGWDEAGRVVSCRVFLAAWDVTVYAVTVRPEEGQ